MKTLLTTTAIALLASAPLLAQEATTEGAVPADATQQEVQAQPAPDATMQANEGSLFLPMDQSDRRYASDLLGMEVYSSQTDYNTYDGAVTADARAEWDSIGSVNDLVVSSEGDVEGVLVDIGGFLGIGARTVALDMSEVHFLGDDTGTQFIAVNSSREQLENAPEFERMEMAQGDPAATTPAPGAPAANDMAPAPAVAGDPAAPGVTDPAAVPLDMTRPTYAREGYADVDYSQLTADDLQGANVYDGNDESVGSISELLLDTDGAIDAAVVDVGGFLGIGAHSVALDFDEIQIMRRTDGADVRVYIDETRDELEQRPAHES